MIATAHYHYVASREATTETRVEELNETSHRGIGGRIWRRDIQSVCWRWERRVFGTVCVWSPVGDGE
jgi:hypothetical protein